MSRARAWTPRVVAIAVAVLLLGACGNLRPPVNVSKRPSKVGMGQVIQVTNISDEHLHEVRVTIRDPDGESREYLIPTLEPHASEDVGWLKLDGWEVPASAEVIVAARGFSMESGPWK